MAPLAGFSPLAFVALAAWILNPQMTDKKQDICCLEWLELDEVEITVLYTFDLSHGYTEHLDMLEQSVITAIRELGVSAKIMIYTQTADDIQFMIEKYAPYVEVMEYDPTQTGQDCTIVTGLTDMEYFDCIGHARIYLIPYLLRKWERPLIYLDSDTGFVVLYAHKYGNYDCVYIYTFRVQCGTRK